ncbi:MAG: copper resistance D family protein [Gemmatimonadota bacterium]
MFAQVLSAGAGWVLFLALILAEGSVAARWVFPIGADGGHGPTSDWIRRQAARVGLVAAALLPIAMALVLVRQIVEFRDPFNPFGEDLKLLLMDTEWGTTWFLATGAAVVASAGFILAAFNRRAGWWMATLATLPLGAFPGSIGHAAGTEQLGSLPLIADTLHVWAAGTWMGGLAVLLLMERNWRERREEGVESCLPHLVPVFSPMAMVSVATLVATGTFAAWLNLPGLSALWETGYGRLLVLKLAIVGLVLLLGAVNWRRLLPRLGEEEGCAAMRRAASLEALLGQVVIFITAILVRTSPLGH